MSDRNADHGSQSALEYYLPGTPGSSACPGPVGQFLTGLFRRRGRF